MDILGDDSTRQDDFMDVEVSTWPFANDLPDTTEGGLLEGPSQRTLAGNFTRYDDFLEVEVSSRPLANDFPPYSIKGGLLKGLPWRALASSVTRQDDFMDVNISTRPHLLMTCQSQRKVAYSKDHHGH